MNASMRIATTYSEESRILNLRITWSGFRLITSLISPKMSWNKHSISWVSRIYETNSVSWIELIGSACIISIQKILVANNTGIIVRKMRQLARFWLSWWDIRSFTQSVLYNSMRSHPPNFQDHILAGKIEWVPLPAKFILKRTASHPYKVSPIFMI